MIILLINNTNKSSNSKGNNDDTNYVVIGLEGPALRGPRGLKDGKV